MENIPEDSAKGRKRVHSAVMDKEKEEEDEYYFKKIKKLVKEKMKLLAEEVEEESKSKLESPTDKKKKMNSYKPMVISNEMLEEFVTNQMNGKEMRLVIKKILYASDLAKSQNRLSMPMNQLETHEFLTEIERQDLEDGKEFEVRLLGPRLKMHEKPMVMRMWHLKSSNSYVLKTNWNEFVKKNKNDLKEKTKIQVWSFRRDEQLCFALHCV